MREPQTVNSDLDALNALLRAFTDLGVYLKLVSEHLAALQRSSRWYDLHLDMDETFRGATLKHEPTETYLAGNSNLVSLESHCEWIPKYVDGVWESVPKVDTALFGLPTRLTDVLDWLTGSPWVARVRRECLDVVLAWPGEILPQTSWGAEKLAGNVVELLKKAEKHPPFEVWSRYYHLIGDWGRDLYAIRGEVLSAGSGHGSVQPPDPLQPPVVLNGPGKPIRVRDIEKPALTEAQYNVTRALIEAGSRGLGKDELANKSGHGDAVNILKRVASIDADWGSVVGLAGKPGGRYRILDLH